MLLCDFYRTSQATGNEFTVGLFQLQKVGHFTALDSMLLSVNKFTTFVAELSPHSDFCTSQVGM